jgi:hypothetical protein
MCGIFRSATARAGVIVLLLPMFQGDSNRTVLRSKLGGPTPLAQRERLHHSFGKIPIDEVKAFDSETRFWLELMGRSPVFQHLGLVNAVIENGLVGTVQLLIPTPNVPAFHGDINLRGDVSGI